MISASQGFSFEILFVAEDILLFIPFCEEQCRLPEAEDEVSEASEVEKLDSSEGKGTSTFSRQAVLLGFYQG